MRRSLFFLVILLLIASSAGAQYIQEGDRELQFSGSFFTVSGITMMNITGLYGKYKTERTEIGGGPSITYTSFSFMGISESSTTVGGMAFIRYNLTAREKTVPYVGGQWYQYDLDPDAPYDFTDFSYLQFGAGFKYFLNENIAYDFSGNFGFSLGGSDVSFLAAFGVAAIY